MRDKKVLLLESNPELLNEMKDRLSKIAGLSVVYAGEDGENGGVKWKETEPDVAVVGMFLKGKDGSSLIKEIRPLNKRVKIIATGIANDALMEEAMKGGADYYLVKPFSIDTAIEKIREMVKERGESEVSVYASAKRKPMTLEEKISDIFMSIGIPPHIKGYGYLREGIKMTVNQPYIINNVTKGLYPSIANLFDTTPSKVERAIRHAIEVAWNRGRIDAINAVFGTRIYLGTEKPTNSEFIALVADKLILENMV